MEESLVVRHEYFGPLIWSRSLGKYFIVSSPDTAQKVGEALRLRCTLTEKTFPELHHDLSVLGYDGTARELVSPFNDRLSGPLEVYLDYTWVCNLQHAKCGKKAHCYAAPFLGNVTLPEARVRSIIRELREWGVMRLHLAGGEPTISYDGLDNYLKTAKKSGILTSFATNGMLIDEKMAEMILRHNTYSVSFSIDGPIEEWNSRIRGKGVLGRSVSGFKLLKRMRDMKKSKTLLCIKPTYTPDQPRQIFDGMCELAVELGADVLKFSNPERCLLHKTGYYKDISGKYYDIALYIRGLQKKYAGRLCILCINNPLTGGVSEIGIPGSRGCIGGQELLTVNPNGRVSPCLMFPLDLGTLGKDFSTLGEMWRTSPAFRFFRERLNASSACCNCAKYGACRSGSNVRKAVDEGILIDKVSIGDYISRKDPLCPLDYSKQSGIAWDHGDHMRSDLKILKPVSVSHSL